MLSKPAARSATRCHHDANCCARCDVLDGLGGLHVTAVDFDHDVGLLIIVVESLRSPMGCGVAA